MTRTDKMDLLDLVSSDDNIQSRLFDMSPSSFIRGKFSDVKYMFEEANSCLQISISRERLNTFDDSSFIYAFQSFLIDFPSQIWLYIISKKKTRKCSTIVKERVLNVSGKLYTNVLNHTARINNILIILS